MRLFLGLAVVLALVGIVLAVSLSPSPSPHREIHHPDVNCVLPSNADAVQCAEWRERRQMAREAELRRERAQRDIARESSLPSRPPSGGPVYVDCNRWGVVNEDSDSAYLAADRGHQCR